MKKLEFNISNSYFLQMLSSGNKGDHLKYFAEYHQVVFTYHSRAD